MSVFQPNSRHLREVLIFCFNLKKTAAEAHRMPLSTYCEVSLIGRKYYYKWFKRFESGDFDDEDWHDSGKEKFVKDA